MYKNFVTNFVTKNKNLSPFWRQNGQYRNPGEMGFDTREGGLVYLDRENKVEASWSDANLINSQSKK